MEFWGWDDSLRSIVDLAHRHKLAVASMSGPWIGLNDPANHDKAKEEIHRCIDIAAQQGIPNLICFSGDRRPGLTDAEGIEFTAAGLKMVAALRPAEGHRAEPGIAEFQGGPQRLPVRPHGLGRRRLRKGRLSGRQAALRHLPHADHGRRHHPDDPREYPVDRPLSHRQATPAATTWTTRRN